MADCPHTIGVEFGTRLVAYGCNYVLILHLFIKSTKKHNSSGSSLLFT